MGSCDCGRRGCWYCSCSTCQRLATAKRTSIHVNAPFVVIGAKVIAAAGSQAKLDIAKAYGGADYTVDYTKPGWQKEVLKITGGKGVNVIYDPVGLINGLSIEESPKRQTTKTFLRFPEVHRMERQGPGSWFRSR
jgi:Zinc-binding dehydrogenase